MDDRTTIFIMLISVWRILSFQPQADCCKTVANALYPQKYMRNIYSHNILKVRSASLSFWSQIKSQNIPPGWIEHTFCPESLLMRHLESSIMELPRQPNPRLRPYFVRGGEHGGLTPLAVPHERNQCLPLGRDRPNGPRELQHSLDQ